MEGIRNSMEKYVFGIVVFVCGAVVMVFELVGSRVFGPYFGTSIFVWTSLIGMILGSLSVGYYVGGILADKKPDVSILSNIILLAAVSIGITVLLKDILIVFLIDSIPDNRWALILASFILFAPAGVLLGIVSPYVVKLRMKNLDISGVTVGNLYALSTAGSIAGTFLAGFYLIPHFGTNRLLVILPLSLVLVAGLLFFGRLTMKKFFFLALLLFFLCSLDGVTRLRQERSGLIDVDSAYNRIWIYNVQDPRTNQSAKIMGINNENHSLMFLNSDDLANEYTKYYHLAEHFFPQFKTALMFGGAGYSFPKDFLRQYPDKIIDVVEIDPKVTELARKYFRLPENPRLSIFHEDGRVYLNRTEKRYDVILGDAFGSRFSVPYQLTTEEAIQKKFDLLNDGGVAIENILSSIEGPKGKFLRAEYATYKSIFSQVFVFPVQNTEDGSEVQNIMLVALKTNKQPSFSDTNATLNSYLQHRWQKGFVTDMPILTDDFAPVDNYIDELL